MGRTRDRMSHSCSVYFWCCHFNTPQINIVIIMPIAMVQQGNYYLPVGQYIYYDPFGWRHLVAAGTSMERGLDWWETKHLEIFQTYILFLPRQGIQ